MRYLTLLFIALSLATCQSKPNAKEKWLRDTLAALRKQADFKPLPLDEAYDFLNEYYLPKLDSGYTGRKIALHPLRPTDRAQLFELKANWLRTGHSELFIPSQNNVPFAAIDSSFNWSEKKLQHCAVITDDLIRLDQLAIKKIGEQIKLTPKGEMVETLMDKQRTILKRSRIAFKKLYGNGYVIVSYPQFNKHFNRLEIKQLIIDYGDCGTGNSHTYFFKKVATGWKEL